ncbi:hypothetical protein [Micromonospora sp. HM5-17]|uniref:hypothetical protein n=1 Tax=Micromonospora sp. HM5-17 TaxID=2487710 RepID=UPI000F47D18C|nr:hypothetical protein [Micromonospora sp. HM5-17]ROT34004.1 hypothetical protein EF879_03755 [Micromonospora sp. HM5-17]
MLAVAVGVPDVAVVGVPDVAVVGVGPALDGAAEGVATETGAGSPPARTSASSSGRCVNHTIAPTASSAVTTPPTSARFRARGPVPPVGSAGSVAAVAVADVPAGAADDLVGAAEAAVLVDPAAVRAGALVAESAPRSGLV